MNNRITKFGYAAMSQDQAHLLRTPKILNELPVRVSAAFGLVYFVGSLLLMQAGGIAEQHVLPLWGIGAALIIFIQRSLRLFAGWKYRRQLKRHEQDGALVFVPLGLLRYVQNTHAKRGLPISDLFDADLQRTKKLVELYKKEHLSPKVQKAVENLFAV